MPAKELRYEIDNRGSDCTWLHMYSLRNNKFVGTVELSLDDMFGLIKNVIENLER